MKNIFLKILIIILFSFSAVVSYGAEIKINMPKKTLDIGEQFFVDIYIDTKGESINGLEGIISFSNKNLKFIRSEDGKSIISLWIEKIAERGGVVNFSGVIPNGFDGLIDPFNTREKKDGFISRLIFETKDDGQGYIKFEDFMGTLNDGNGTARNIENKDISFEIRNSHNQSIYLSPISKPTIYAEVVKDKNIYNGRYVLVFDAKDDVGVKEVLVKEGRRKWKEANSPYLLEDQSRHSIISIQAVNYSGSGATISIDKLPYNLLTFNNILIIFVLIVVLLFIIKNIYVKHKKKNI